MREQFENLPEIAKYLRLYCHWDEFSEDYRPNNPHDNLHDLRAEYVNGAYYAFKEQQKRIETVFQKMDDMGMVDVVQILEDYIGYSVEDEDELK